MRYLITSTRSATEIILGYDADGLLCELQLSGYSDAEAVEWLIRRAPVHEAEMRSVFNQDHLRFTNLQVSFDEFWRNYPRKEGKLRARKLWDAMPQTKQQLAFNYLSRYREQCRVSGTYYMHPDTYLRAERWQDQH